MEKSDLKIEILPPEMSGLPAYWRLTGSPQTIRSILTAIEDGKI